jgi:predicted nucleic acid-binding protein
MPEEKDPNIIIDASSLIALYKLGLIDILKDLYASINVPGAVLSE